MDDKKRILIVDDVKANIDILKSLLEANYNLHAALNGLDAIKVTKLIDPDLILLDVNMPGLDGYEVTQRLRSNLKSKAIPIIMVTANNSPEEELKCLKHGATDYVSKPINRQLLFIKIDKYI